MGGIHFRGTVVEQQTYLDGARSYTLEAEEHDAAAGSGWSLELSLRWDAVTQAAVEEADLTLGRGDLELLGAASGGVITLRADEEQGYEALTLRLVFDLLPAEDDAPPPSASVTVEGAITGDDVELVVFGLPDDPAE